MLRAGSGAFLRVLGPDRLGQKINLAGGQGGSGRTGKLSEVLSYINMDFGAFGGWSLCARHADAGRGQSKLNQGTLDGFGVAVRGLPRRGDFSRFAAGRGHGDHGKFGFGLALQGRAYGA